MKLSEKNKLVFTGVLGEGINTFHNVGSVAGINKSPKLPELIGGLISVLLGTLGIIFIILIIQSGIEYMTSNGAEDKVKEAKKRIVSAVIGIIIIVSAYAISSFVITAISNATSGTETAPASPASPAATPPFNAPAEPAGSPFNNLKL